MQFELFATPFEKVVAELEEALQIQAKADEKVKELTKQRNEMCPHLVVEQRQYYFSGSYYDRAYTDYWTECKCCGAKSEVTTEQHSWYG